MPNDIVGGRQDAGTKRPTPKQQRKQPARSSQAPTYSDARDTYQNDQANAIPDNVRGNQHFQNVVKLGRKDVAETEAYNRRQSSLSSIINPYFHGLIDQSAADPQGGNQTLQGLMPGASQAQSAQSLGVMVQSQTGSPIDSVPSGFKYEPWMRKHPQIVQAGLAAKIGMDDWQILSNYFAVQEAKSSLAAASTFSPEMISRVYSSLSPAIRDIAVEQLQAASKATSPAEQANPDDESTWLSNTWNAVYDHSIGIAMDAWVAATEWTQHVDRANQMTTWNSSPEQLQQDVGNAASMNIVGFLQNRIPGIINNWDATATGTYDPKLIADAQAKYGATQVQMLQDLIASVTNTQDPYGAYITKYGMDENALNVLHQWMDPAARDDQFTGMMAAVGGADTGDLGVMTMTHLFGVQNSQQDWSKYGAVATNVASTIMSDPTLWASKAFVATRMAKYAMAMTAVEAGDVAAYGAAAGNVDRLMRIKSVRRFWDTLGDLGQQYRAARLAKDDELAARIRVQMDQTVKGAMGRREKMMASTYEPQRASAVGARPNPNLLPVQPFMPGGAPRYTTLAQEIIDQGIDDADIAGEWLKSGIGMELILQGSPAAGTPLMPRIGAASASRLVRMMRSKKWDWQKHGWDFIRTYYGQGLDAEQLGIALNAKGTMAARGAELGIDPNSNRGYLAGINLLGRDRKGLGVRAYRYGDASWSRRMDRFLKNFTRAPFSNRIEISDARDVEKIRTWARVTLDKPHADLIADKWMTASVAERRTIVQGLGLTAAQAMGIHLNEAETAKLFMQSIVDGVSIGTNYGTTYTTETADAALLARMTLDPSIYAKLMSGGSVAENDVSMHELAGLRLQMFGGAASPEHGDLLLRQRLAGLIGKKKDLEEQRKILQERIAAYKGVQRGMATKTALKAELAQIENDLRINGRDITNEIADNERVGRTVAAQMGLHGVTELRDFANLAVDTAVGESRLAGIQAANEVRDAAQALRPAVERGDRGAFRELMNEAAQVPKRRINEVAKDARADAHDVINDVAVQAKDDIRLARDMQAVLGKENTETLRDLFKELAEVRRAAKKAAGKPLTPAQQQALIDKADRIQAKIEDLAQQAGLTTWKIAQTKEQLAYTQALRDTGGNVGMETVNPSVLGDKSHALHMRQTANHITIPDFQKMQQLAARTGIVNATLGMSYSDWAAATTDLWSIATLAGPRYALRNALEDAIFYNLSTSKFSSYLRARKSVRAIRIAGGQGNGLITDTVMGRWFPYVTEDEVRDAATARKAGDMQPFRDLVARGVARGQIAAYGKRFNNPQMYKYLDELLETGHADHFLNSIARTAVQTVKQSNGTAGSTVGIAAKDDSAKLLGFRSPQAHMRMRNADVRWVNLHLENNDEGIDAWWTAINDFAEGDGPLGHAAIVGIRKLQGAKTIEERNLRRKQVEKDLADIINKTANRPNGYAQRFSMINEHGADAFAHAYLQEAETVFSGPVRGMYNEALLDRIMPKGKWIGMSDDVNGKQVFRVYRHDLASMPDKPKAIIGPESRPLPMTGKMQNGMDSLWALMGDQYARLSTEPQFIARYLEQRVKLAGHQQAIAAVAGDDVAAKTVTRLAADRSYEELFSYADNPANRSLIAFNARNIARYYRATEDFYRRVLRLARYHPDQVAKAALIANIMDDSGFVHQDDQGNKYFMYPNGIPAINGLMEKLGVPIHIPSVYGEWQGRFDMLTPSADPTAWLPTFSGPFLAVPIAAIANVWEPFAAVEGATLGRKSIGRSWMDTVLPTITTQALGLAGAYAGNDELNGKFAANLRNVLFARAAHGDVPGPESSPQDLENWKNDSRTQAEGMTILQAVLRLFLPASPQFNAGLAGSASSEAAAAGLGNLRTDFLKMVVANQNQPDPWGAAMYQWIKMNPKWSIWTVSKSQDVTTARVYRTNEAADWVQSNMDLFQKVSKEGAGYLIPAGGASTIDANRRLSAYGILTPKSVDDIAMDIVTSERINHYYDVIDYNTPKIAAMPPGPEKSAAKARMAAWRAQYVGNPNKGIVGKYPLVGLKIDESNTRAIKKTSLQEIQKVLTYVREKRPDQYTSDKSLPLIDNMIVNYQHGLQQIAQITGQTKADDALKAKIKSNMITWLRKQCGIDATDGSTDQRAVQVYQNLMARTLGDDS